jgi:hypothetical protein
MARTAHQKRNTTPAVGAIAKRYFIRQTVARRARVRDDGAPRAGAGYSGFTNGKRMVSRMPSPVMAISSRSRPMPMPPVGGMPYSMARR